MAISFPAAASYLASAVFSAAASFPASASFQSGAFDPLSGAPSFWGAARLLTGLSNLDPVTTFTDQSGNGRDFTQGTGVYKPVYTTGLLNSQPGLAFNGAVGTRLIAGVDLSNFIANNAYTLMGVVSVIAAAGGDGSGYNERAILADGTADAVFGMIARNNNVVGAFNYDNSSDVATSAISLSTPYIFTQQHTAGNLTIQVNDNAAANVASGNTLRLDLTPQFGVNYDGTLGVTMNFFEFIIFPDVKDAAFIASMKTFWKDPSRYGAIY